MSEPATPGGPVRCQSAAEVLEHARQTAFMWRHNQHEFNDQHRGPVIDVAWFPSALLDSLDIRFRMPYLQVLNTSKVIVHVVHLERVVKF